MFLRTILLMLTFAFPLSATEFNGFSDDFELTSHKICCTGCGTCKQKLSSFDLLQIVQGILNNNILLLPQVRNQLSAQLQRIINEGGLGIVGPRGPVGQPGPAGPIGPSGLGGIIDFADFFALMPPDNATTVAVGGDVDFPQDGPSSGSGLITRSGISIDSFNLAEIGIYQVFFQVSATEAGQLILTLNGAELPYTVVGRATGTSQIIGMALVETTVSNSILTVRNPAGNSTALTITPFAGGTRPVSAHLVITRIQ